MSIKLETKFLEGFISEAEMSSMKEKTVAAAEIITTLEDQLKQQKAELTKIYNN